MNKQTNFSLQLIDLSSSELGDLQNISPDCKTLVVIQEIDKNEENLMLLEKILAAVNKSHFKAICLKQNQSYHLSNNLTNTEVKEILIFGIEPDNLHLAIKAVRCKPISILGCKLMFAPALSEIAESVSIKKEIWQGLKLMFA